MLTLMTAASKSYNQQKMLWLRYQQIIYANHYFHKENTCLLKSCLL